MLDEWVANSDKDGIEQFASTSDNWYNVGRVLLLAILPLCIARTTRPDASNYYAVAKAWMTNVKADWRVSYPFLLWNNNGGVGTQNPETLDVTLGCALFATYAIFAHWNADTTERDYWIARVRDVFDYYISQGANPEFPLGDNLAHTRMATVLLYWSMYGLTNQYRNTSFSNWSVWFDTYAYNVGEAMLWNHSTAVPAVDAQPLTYARYTYLMMWALHYLQFPYVTTPMLQQVARTFATITFATYPTIGHRMDNTSQGDEVAYNDARLSNASYALAAEHEATMATLMATVNDNVESGDQSKPHIPACMVAAGL